MAPLDDADRRADPAAADRPRHQRERQPGERGGEAGRGFGDAGDGIRDRHHPVEEDGLLEAVFVVVVGGDPVALFDHFPRRLRVEGLVGIADRRASESREERDQAEGRHEESMPEHADGLYTTDHGWPGDRGGGRVERSRQVRQSCRARVPAPGLRRQAGQPERGHHRGPACLSDDRRHPGAGRHRVALRAARDRHRPARGDRGQAAAARCGSIPAPSRRRSKPAPAPSGCRRSTPARSSRSADRPRSTGGARPAFDRPRGRSYTRPAGRLPPAPSPTSTVDIRFHPQLILAVARHP